MLECTPGSVPRVLVVDDEPALCELLVDALGDLDIQVWAAGSGDEAIRLARRHRPDLLVTDLYLGDCNGWDVIDRLRSTVGEIPVVVITGRGDPATLTRASRSRPVELMTKPLDIERLRGTITEELARQAENKLHDRRARRLRTLARTTNLERKDIRKQLDSTCVNLTEAYRSLSGQMAIQQSVLGFQRDLLAAANDDDVFRSLFRLFVRRSGSVFGVAMVCDAGADLQIIGRFGVPKPDNTDFCRKIVAPMIERVLATPNCQLMDAWTESDLFDLDIREYLVGVSILAIPLLPTPGELIGLVCLYRKGEQPFTDEDVELAEMVSAPTALTVRRND